MYIARDEYHYVCITSCNFPALSSPVKLPFSFSLAAFVAVRNFFSDILSLLFTAKIPASNFHKAMVATILEKAVIRRH